MSSLRRWVEGRSAEGWFRALATCVAFLCGIQVLTIALSVARIPITQWIAAGILLASLAGAILCWRLSRTKPSSETPQADSAEPSPQGLWPLAIVALAFFPVLALLAYATPDLSCDGNWYHIPTLSLWDQTGYVHWIDGLPARLGSHVNGFPKGVELVAYVLVKASGDSRLAHCANLLYLPLGVFGIAFLARALGASSVTALFAGAAFILVPVNINQSGAAYVDSAFASCAVAFLAALVATVRSGPRAGLVIPLGAGAALALGAKSTGVALVGIGLAVLFAWLAWRSLRAPVGERHAGRGVVFLAAALAIAFAGGGHWYLRNYVVTGTPLYPVGVKVAGRVIFPGMTVGETVEEGRNTPARLRPLLPPGRILYTWCQGFWNWPSTVEKVGSRYGGMGFLWLLGCIPAIAWAAWRRRDLSRPARASLLVLGVVAAAAFVVTPYNWWARFTVWLYALGLPCFALLVERAARRRPVSPARMLGVLCIGLVFFEGTYCAWRTFAEAYVDRTPYVGRPDGIASPWLVGYLFPQTRGTPIERVLTDGGVVAVGPMVSLTANGRFTGEILGELSLPVGRRKIVFVDSSCTHAQLVGMGADWLLWDRMIAPPADVKSCASAPAQAAGFLLFEIRK